MQKLRELFPGRDQDSIAGALQASEGDLTEAVDSLLCEENLPQALEHRGSSSNTAPPENPCSSSQSETTQSGEVTLQGLVTQAGEGIDFTKFVDITVRRESVWRDGFSVYKNALLDPSTFMKDLRVELVGQEGVDARAKTRLL